MRKFVKQIVVSANIFAVLLLCLAYLAKVIDPERIEFIQIFGLAYLYSLLLNLVFVIFWSVKKSKWLFLSVFFILIGWNTIKLTFQLNTSNAIENSIKIVSYNVRAFDRFDWTKQKHSKQKIFNFIKEEQPDIICYQEFFSKNKKGLSTFDTLLILQNAKNHHLAYYKHPKELNLSGVATFTRFPIVNKGKIEEDGHIISLFTDLKINNDTVRIYNNHLQSVHFGQDNYFFLDNIKNSDEKKIFRGVKNIYNKLMKGYKKRSIQAKILRKHIDNCRYKKIICGDFNDAATSFAYDEIRSNLNDAFEEVGAGFDFSYVRGILKFRIDFILHSKNIFPVDFKTKNYPYSDHYPLIFTFQL